MISGEEKGFGKQSSFC